MCGCTGGKNYTVDGKGCSGRISDLQRIRNSLITLEKLTKGPKKQEYKDVRTEIEVLLREASTTCPDPAIVSGLKNYVSNEYTINNIKE